MAIKFLKCTFSIIGAVLSLKTSHIDPIAPMPQSKPAGKGYTTFKPLHTHCQCVHVGVPIDNFYFFHQCLTYLCVNFTNQWRVNFCNIPIIHTGIQTHGYIGLQIVKRLYVCAQYYTLKLLCCMYTMCICI